MPRFALLEHSGAPDDPAGVHYDLVVEAGTDCRTWRLEAVPIVGGPAVAAREISRHRLAWLDHLSGPVSLGRGFARRIDAGTCRMHVHAIPSTVEIEVDGAECTGVLRLEQRGDGWVASLAGRPED